MLWALTVQYKKAVKSCYSCVCSYLINGDSMYLKCFYINILPHLDADSLLSQPDDGMIIFASTSDHPLLVLVLTVAYRENVNDS